MSNLGDLAIDLVVNDDDFTLKVKNADKLLRQITRQFEGAAKGSNRFSGGMRGAAKTLRDVSVTAAAVKFTLMDLNRVLLSFPKAILKTTGEFERLQKLMEGMSKAVEPIQRLEEAKESMGGIINLSKNAPFAVDSLADAFVKLKVGGLEPLDGYLKTLSDSVAKFGGDSDILKRAAVAIQQMGGKGVISMEELRQQLGEAIPDAMQAMATGMGISVAKLNKIVSDGVVETGPALKQMFAVLKFSNDDAAKDMMNTWMGVNSRLQTEWQLLQRTVGTAGFAEAAKDVVKEFTEILSSPEMHRWATEIGVALKDITVALGTGLKFLFEYRSAIGHIAGSVATFWAISKALSAVNAAKGHIVSANAVWAKSLLEQRAIENTNASLAKVQAIDKVKDQKQFIQLISEETAAQRVQHRELMAQLDAQQRKRVQQGMAAVTSTGNKRGGHRSQQVQFGGDITRTTAQAAAVASAIQANEQLLRSETKLLRGFEGTSAAMDKKALAAARAAQGITTLDRANKALSIGWAAMGGWLGAISLALTAGAALWRLWGNTGERAIKKVQDAINNRTATEEDMETYKKGLDKDIKERDYMQRQFDMLTSGPDGIQQYIKQFSMGGACYSAEEIEAITQSLSDSLTGLNKKIKEKTESLEVGSRVVADNAYRDGRSAAEADAQVRIREDMAPFAKQVADLKEQVGAELNAARASGNTKLIEELEAKYNEEPRAIMAEAFEVQRAFADEALKKAEAAYQELLNLPTATATQIERAKGEVDAYADLKTQAQDQVVALRSGVSSLALKSDKNKGANKEDPVLTAIEQAKAATETAKIRMDDLRDGAIDLDRIRASVIAKVQGEIASGRYGKGKSRPALESANIQLLVEARTLQQQAEIVARANQQLDDLSAKINKSQRASVKALFDRHAADDAATGLGRLQAAFEELLPTVQHNAEEAAKLTARYNELVPKQALIDLADMGAQFREEARSLALDNMNPRARLDATYREEVANIKRRFEAAKAAAEKSGELEVKKTEIIKKAHDEMYAHLRELDIQYEREKRTGLDQMVEDWQNSTLQMETATASWADGFIDVLTEFTTTGAFKWREFLAGMLTDMSRMSLQAGFGGFLKQIMEGGQSGESSGGIAGMFGGVLDWIKGAGAKATGGAEGKGGDVKAVSALGEAATKAATEVASAGQESSLMSHLLKMLGISQKVQGATTEVALMTLSQAALAAAASLAAIASSSGGGGGMLGMLGALAQGAIGLGSGGAGGLLSGTVGAGQPVMASTAASFKFAKGGVMTEFGPVALRKYAKGGIANKPQLALFGEGSHNEAYVPLPDGRRIPVALEGSTGGNNVVTENVAINITVNEAEGDSSESSSGSKANDYKNMADGVRNVVREELARQKRANGMLSQ